MRVTVAAQRHERFICPISFEVDGPMDSPALVADSGNAIVCQAEGVGRRVRVHAVVPYVPKGATLGFELVSLPSAVSPGSLPSVKLTDSAGKVDVHIAGDYFTTYAYGTGAPKPYLGPVMGPHGESITRLDLDAQEHPHHKSVWFSHGDINGVDLWGEAAPGTGFERHQQFTALHGGPVFARIASTNLWTDAAGLPLLTDEREYRFYNTPAHCRIIDMSLKLTASHQQVTFGATKEGGPLGIRVAETMNVDVGGTMDSAYEGCGEPECWGHRAPWCDYSGLVGGRIVGIAGLDHPSNPEYPTYWHIRDYGLMAMNNFNWAGAVTLAKGEAMFTQYRLICHGGTAAEAHISEHFHAYANPPLVTVT